jgi:hypothetical protein
MDTVKQKRQLNIKNYTGTFDCIRKVIVTEGMSSLYAGYMTTLVMNIPYNFFYFPAYEMFRSMLKADAGEHDVFAHIIAGGGFVQSISIGNKHVVLLTATLGQCRSVRSCSHQPVRCREN